MTAPEIITIYCLQGIPIVTNMKIEGKADSDPVVTKVYWYIKTDTASDAEYSLGDLQISL